MTGAARHIDDNTAAFFAIMRDSSAADIGRRLNIHRHGRRPALAPIGLVPGQRRGQIDTCIIDHHIDPPGLLNRRRHQPRARARCRQIFKKDDAARFARGLLSGRTRGGCMENDFRALMVEELRRRRANPA